MIRAFKIWFYGRRLERLIRKQRESFETRDFAKRRKAALRHEPRSWAS